MQSAKRKVFGNNFQKYQLLKAHIYFSTAQYAESNLQKTKYTEEKKLTKIASL